MAVRLLTKSRTALTYSCAALRGVTPISQVFSSDVKRGLGSQERNEESAGDEPGATVWPDPNLGFLGPQDRRLPLPGNVGLGCHLFTHPEADDELRRQATNGNGFSECDLLTCPLPQERRAAVLTQAMHTIEVDIDRADIELLATGEILECIIQDCPQLIRKDFSDLFPGMDIMSGYFTVVTFSQRTSPAPDGEDIAHEELMLYFVIAAEEMCLQLKDLGFWADFIDPSSNHYPYRSPYVSASVLETDERYRRLGFMIEDLGRCKVATHHAWSPQVFVGCLFTNAPASSSLLRAIVERHHGRRRSGHVD